jgi:hypothetical protein
MTLYLVVGRDPHGMQVEDVVLDARAAFDAVTRFEQRGVTDIRMVEVQSGREIDWRKLRQNQKE